MNEDLKIWVFETPDCEQDTVARFSKQLCVRYNIKILLLFHHAGLQNQAFAAHGIGYGLIYIPKKAESNRKIDNILLSFPAFPERFSIVKEVQHTQQVFYIAAFHTAHEFARKPRIAGR